VFDRGVPPVQQPQGACDGDFDLADGIVVVGAGQQNVGDLDRLVTPVDKTEQFQAPQAGVPPQRLAGRSASNAVRLAEVDRATGNVSPAKTGASRWRRVLPPEVLG
jgi:hypothetical protein